MQMLAGHTAALLTERTILGVCKQPCTLHNYWQWNDVGFIPDKLLVHARERCDRVGLAPRTGHDSVELHLQTSAPYLYTICGYIYLTAHQVS